MQCTTVNISLEGSMAFLRALSMVCLSERAQINFLKCCVEELAMAAATVYES